MPSRGTRTRLSRLTHERRVLLLALAAGLPGTALGLVLLWTGSFATHVQWTLTLLVVLLWLAFAFATRERVVFPLQTVSNLLAALREEDFSIRARGSRSDDALGEVLIEVNALADMLRSQRLGALDATSLLRAVMEEIPVAVFAFDPERRLRLVNRAGEELLAQPAERLLGLDAESLGLAACLNHDRSPTLDVAFPGGSGRWEIRTKTFRQGGIPLELLVLTDVSRSLRDEERLAWQRLIRVIGHEINNSLAPIKSVAHSLERSLEREPRPPDWEHDLRSGLDVISARADALSRFTAAYAQLARLPAPSIRPVPLRPLVERVTALERRGRVTVRGGPDVTVHVDPDQLEQLLINLLRNAVEATPEGGGEATVSWDVRRGRLRLRVEDEGPGVSNTANLFVPFFTTKPGGSGIGLVLSRQIAEAHGGTLTLENREPGPGARAILTLPV
ncbi:MAG TPA: ATP-binding protein [Vicinamibacterales bacterium]|nr:ATP-binding protein [Vicinamibacterales bacterium]